MTHLSAKRVDEAASYAQEALELTRRLGARGNEAHALCLTGDVASTVGTEDGQRCYREALALAEPRGMRPLAAHCYFGLGRLNGRMGQYGEAKKYLNIATAMTRCGHDLLVKTGCG
jgi:hypothetical protein